MMSRFSKYSGIEAKQEDDKIDEKVKRKKYNKRRIAQIVDDAEEAFWGTVGDLVPEATHGDVDPGMQMKLTKTMQDAVDDFIEFNVPPKQQ